MERPDRTGISAGDTFHRWTVVSRGEKDKKGRTQWLCKCECGQHRSLLGCKLKSGHSKSCGCYSRDRTVERSFKHGAARRGNNTPEFKAWQRMLGRCFLSTDHKYSDYGGRGITVCDEWKSFSTFLSDMGTRPSAEHSLDRINVNGDYCPENCRWATLDQQANNKRRTIVLGYQGIVRTLSDWARVLELPSRLFRERYWRGWTTEEILFGKDKT